MKLLYLYDFEEWAIHNVGKIWLDDIRNVEVTYKKSTDFTHEDLQNFDLIWFGYLDLFFNTYLTWDKSKRLHKNKIIISVHDPLELYPQVENWRNLKMSRVKFWDENSKRLHRNIKALKYAKSVVVASSEMKMVLKKYGLDSHLIPTASMLPLRDKSKIKIEEAKILSVYQVFARKNIPLMDSISESCEVKLGVQYDRKVGRDVLPTLKYIELLDSHPIYICTSFQEGGPIPAMDAMKRGAVVLTTPVGQVQDIIKSGVNGYICSSKEDFLDAIARLKDNPQRLRSMRLKSIETIKRTRNLKEIKKVVSKYLEEVTA